MEKLIYELKSIYNKYQILDKEKSDFNVFKSFLNPYDEVNLHSKMIHTILSEKKYQKEFLISFLANIGISLNKKNNNIKNIIIEREKSIDLGRLDLFISFMANNKDYKIIIENKIYAEDGERQLDRYLTYLNNNPGDEKYVYYLTLHGYDPTEKSTKNIDQIYSISYENHILDWINECIKISAREPKIRESLIQYGELIEEITGKDVDYIMETKNYFLENSDNFNMAIDLEPAITEAKVDLQFKFWEKLEEALVILFDEEKKLTIKSLKGDSKLGNLNKWYSKDIIEDNYQKIRGSSYYGLVYDLGIFEDIGPLFLKFEYDRYYGLYYGLRLNIEKINKNSNKYEMLWKQLEANGFKFSDWWLGWKNLKCKDKIIYFSFKDQDFVETLMDDEKLDKLIGNITKEISEFIDLVSNYK